MTPVCTGVLSPGPDQIVCQVKDNCIRHTYVPPVSDREKPEVIPTPLVVNNDRQSCKSYTHMNPSRGFDA